MLFHSAQYAFFLLLVVGIYFHTPLRWRWFVLLSASIIFYMAWKPIYIVLVLVSAGIDYWAARLIEDSKHANQRRSLLILSCVSNLALLGIFKYAGFFSRAGSDLAALLGLTTKLPAFDLLLPVGISFYTFQSMSYTIDVYRKELKAERRFGPFLLFVLFFPQLVAGPIERAGHLLGQLKRSHQFIPERVVIGLRWILWGLFKKMIIADGLSDLVNEVYQKPTYYSGTMLLLATYGFALQIYADFSGYSDIALGSAKILDIDLMRNFRQPYLATSIDDFWRRWHVSLSTWFRDYVYRPLGGNRVSQGRWIFNIAAVFLLSGFWHGANWTFIVWGALHALYFLLFRTLRNIRSLEALRSRRFRCLHWFFTFQLVALAWVFFRADSVGSAILIVQKIFNNLDPVTFPLLILEQIPSPQIAAILVLAGVEWIWDSEDRSHSGIAFLKHSLWLRWSAYLILSLLILNYGRTNEVPFIYFQF